METIIRYYIETLNRENGSSVFEKLASSLAEKEICSNILPSTGPYGGGDKGTDARTYTTYLTESSKIFKLYQSSKATPTKKKIIFAFSIEKGWKAKFSKDAEKIIVKYKLQPDKICFITNQFIKSLKREKAIEELIKKYSKVDFEIFDGEWITKKLTGPHYNLLVQCGAFPETRDPNVEELYSRIYSFRSGGMTDEESVKVKDLIQKTSYRASYSDIIEQRAIDLKTIADIQAKYTKFIDESIKFYEEALGEIANIYDKSLVVDIYYSYFVALQKLRLYKKLATNLPEFRDFIVSNDLIEGIRYVFTWIMYLSPHQKEIDGLNLTEFTKETFEIANKLNKKGKPRHIKALLDEGTVIGKHLLTMLGIRKDNLIEIWKTHIESVKDIPLYPLQSMSKIVAALAIPYEGTTEYEDLYKFAEKILLDRNQKLDAAQLRKNRAMNLYQVGKYADVIHHLNIVKLEWYSHETIRGSMLSSFTLQDCYSQLNLYYAAIQELFTVLHLSTSDDKILTRHKDLFIQALAQIYFKYLELGLWGSAVIMGKLALLAVRRYRLEPSLGKEKKGFEFNFSNNTMTMLGEFTSKFPELSKRIVKILDSLHLSILDSYRMMFEESDESFKKGWEGHEKEFKEALRLRKELRDGKYKFFENSGIKDSRDETLEAQERHFAYEGVGLTLSFENTYENKLISEYLLSLLQMIFVELFNTAKFVWIEKRIKLKLLVDDSVADFEIREKPDNEAVNLDIAISPSKIESFYKSPFDMISKLEQYLFVVILNQCTIDNSEYIKGVVDTLGENGFFGSLAGRLPFGVPFKTFYTKKDYLELMTK